MAPNLPFNTITEACADPTLLNLALSDAQAACLKAVYALPMDDAELALFQEATGRPQPPTEPFKTINVLAGRRSGKSSHICAPLAVYEACIASHAIPETERGLVTVLGPSTRQARTTFRMIQRMIERSPKLRGLIESVRTGDENEIQLSNSIDIRVLAANQRTIRGDLIVAAICEESNFFRDSDSGQYNLSEILDAIRPALLTLPDSKLICVSSPWVALGPMWESFQKRAERPEELCWKLPSWTMNPSINSARLWFEKTRDPQKFAREYGAEFLEAAGALIPSELIDKAVQRGTRGFPSSNSLHCVAGLDPSSKGTDCFGFALAHKTTDDKIILDLARQWKPPGNGQFLDYGGIVPEIVEQMNARGATKIFSDQICAAALASMFQKYGMTFEQVSTFGTKAAELYRTVRQLFVAGKVVLPDDPEVIGQFKKLEEILAEGGKSVVQASSGKDDLAVASCLAIYEASLLPVQREVQAYSVFVDGALDDSWEERFWARQRMRETVRTPSFGRN
jgi:hypothetical protein